MIRMRQLLPFFLVLATTGLFADDTRQDDTLRVCAAQDELPYSDSSGNGFENQLARVFGDALDKRVEFVWSERPGIYLVGDYLNEGLCDVVMGVDEDDSRVLTTKPYYRSTYLFVYRSDSDAEVADWQSPALDEMERFAIARGTPAEAALRRIGKYEGNLNYMFSLIDFQSQRNQYVRFHPARMIREVVEGEADIAIVWGPEAARYIERASESLEVVPVPDLEAGEDSRAIAFQYDQSLAVRKDDEALLERLNQVLEQHGDRIRQVLDEEGIPLVSCPHCEPSLAETN